MIIERDPVVRAALAPYRAAELLRDIDVEVAAALVRLAGETDPRVALAAAGASAAPSRGHVCFDLARPRELLEDPETLLDVDGDTGVPVVVEWPDAESWRRAVSASPLVTGSPAPLYLDGTRVYLARYHAYQDRLTDAIVSRTTAARSLADPERMRQRLARLTEGFSSPEAVDRQKLATLVATLRPFVVISGGPGTGKTTTVLRVLVSIIEERRALGQSDPRIALVAPTGKAAARLTATIRREKKNVKASAEVLAAVPDEATTIHRRLGFHPGRPSRIRHNARTPLPYDVVVCDEASMVDLALMARLVEAVPLRGRLILLGDRDQLASVEAGAVLADVCNGGAPGRWSKTLGESVRPVMPEVPADWFSDDASPTLADSIIELSYAHRFRDSPELSELAAAIRDGKVDRAVEVLRSDDKATKLVECEELEEIGEIVKPRAIEAWRAVRAAADDPAAALAATEKFRVLAAHRRGEHGVESLNRAIQGWIAQSGTIVPDTEHYPGRPILITQNDYGVGLFNGDSGIVLGAEPSRRRAYFLGAKGEPLAFVLGTLPPHETVFAMTVHKSQGSEFDDVIVVLPPEPTPLLTRGLLYTAVTRARKSVVVVGKESVLRAGVARQIDRATGLKERLWSGARAGA